MFIKEVYKILKNKLNKKTVICTLVAVVFFVSAFFGMSSYTVAVAVVCNGEDVGYVTSTSDAENIKTAVKGSVYGEDFGALSIKFEDRYVNSSSISSEDKIIENALSSLEGVKKYTGLYVDGVLTAVAETEEQLQSMIDAAAKSYTESDMRYIGILNSIEIKDAYVYPSYIDSLATTVEDFCLGKSGIEFMTSRYESYVEEIQYSTEVTHDVTKIQGYSYTKRKGKMGESFVNASVVYVNGKKVGADIISSEVIKKPVSALVVEGISEQVMSEVRLNYAAENEGIEPFTFPCQITEKTYISSYWGDNRNHKAIDVASPKGSEIYAAHSGTVVKSGSHAELGKYLVLDHGDGKTETVYAHCSELLVSKGDTVTEGQVIALVGNTGRSTGNHLHFAVHINGRPVDPAHYIGLY